MKEKLIAQIAAEAKELAEVPKIPLKHFIQPTRCQMCGNIVSLGDLLPMEGASGRLACEVCRGQ